MNKYTVAVVGASGAVGSEMIKILEERNFPVGSLVPVASERSAGNFVSFKNKDLSIELLEPKVFNGVDIALFSAGGEISEKYAPIAAKAGAVVVDNSSAFRMDKRVPLVVPEVNPEKIADYKNCGIIANPNCSTIQLVVVLNPIHKRYGIKRVVVSTYQSTSGAGREAMDELSSQSVALFSNRESEPEVFQHRIAFNLIPHIDSFLENGFTKEEMKLINETHKIMGDNSILVSPTAVRVPVFYAHSESVNIELVGKASSENIRKLLSASPGIVVQDDPGKNLYPMPINACGKDEVFVGRIREDKTVPSGIQLWIVADNIRKGAALNAIQIAEILVKEYL